LKTCRSRAAIVYKNKLPPRCRDDFFKNLPRRCRDDFFQNLTLPSAAATIFSKNYRDYFFKNLP
jgi:hypothetical protein